MDLETTKRLFQEVVSVLKNHNHRTVSESRAQLNAAMAMEASWRVIERAVTAPLDDRDSLGNDYALGVLDALERELKKFLELRNHEGYEERVETLSNNFSHVERRLTEQFGDQREASRSQRNTALQRRVMELEEKLRNLNANITEIVVAKFVNETDEYRKKLADAASAFDTARSVFDAEAARLNEQARQFEAIEKGIEDAAAKAGGFYLSKEYRAIADAMRDSRRLWQRATVAAFIAWAGAAVWRTHSLTAEVPGSNILFHDRLLLLASSLDWPAAFTLVMHTTPFALATAFCALQVRKQSALEGRYLTQALELGLVDAFVSPLPDEAKVSIRTRLADKFFTSGQVALERPKHARPIARKFSRLFEKSRK